MDKVTISVAMATYNGAQFLAEQLDSILHQTMKVDEIVVSDDGSSDETWSILSKYVEQYPQIHIYKSKENALGPNKNFIKAFSHCRGEYIFPCDQDDIWFPNKVETLMSRMDRGIDLVYAQDQIICTTGETKNDIWYLPIPEEAIYKNRLKGHTCVFRRRLLDLYGHSGCMSWDFVLSLYCVVTGRGKGISDYLMYWRRHENAVTYQALPGITVMKDTQKPSKWEAYKQTQKCLRKGETSSEVRAHMNSRSQYIMYLLTNYPCDRKRWKRLAHVLKYIAEQTVFSMYKAGIVSAYNAYIIKMGSEESIKDRIANCMHGFRTPYNEWWAVHAEKYLG